MKSRVWILVAALGTSAAAHVGLAGLSWQPNDAVLDGGALAGAASLGSSFADLVAYIPESPKVSAVSTLMPTSVTEISATALATVEAVDHVVTTQIAATQIETKLATLTPAPVQPLVTVTRAKVTAARPLTSTQASTSVLPPVRPQTRVEPVPQEEPVAKPKPQKKKTPAKKQVAAKSQRGNATANARRGSQDAEQVAPNGGGTGATETTAKQAGNGALKSYKTAVLRKVSRTRARSAGGRGSVHVSLRISAAGAVSGVTVAKSSGNTRVDRAALAKVSGAGNFGATPNGQAVRYTIKVDVKG